MSSNDNMALPWTCLRAAHDRPFGEDFPLGVHDEVAPLRVAWQSARSAHAKSVIPVGQETSPAPGRKLTAPKLIVTRSAATAHRQPSPM